MTNMKTLLTAVIAASAISMTACSKKEEAPQPVAETSNSAVAVAEDAAHEAHAAAEEAAAAAENANAAVAEASGDGD